MPEQRDIRPPARCLVDGDWLTADDADPFVVVDPFTEQPLGSTPEAGPDIVDRAVRAARGLATEWRDTPVQERAALLERVADLLAARTDEMSELVGREMGMPVGLARVTQAELPAVVLRATAALGRTFAWREPADGAVLLRRGAGVVGAVTPWNMPVHQIVAKIAAAIVSGSTVVLKPAEQTPYDAALLAALFAEAGAPPGLLNLVTGTGPITGAALAGHPDLDRLSFTGSVRAGRAVAAAAGAALTRCALELGGKSPALVLPDADLDRALPAVVGSGLVNSGQACNATTRLLVPAARLDESLERIATASRAQRLGDPADPTTQQGPLVSARQQAAVLDRIQAAVADGGRLLAGTGQPSAAVGHGFFVDPTVIVGLDERAAAVREEIFGPVLVVQPYRDEDDAVRLANDSDYGLSAEVWSADPEHAAAVADRLLVGQVKINGVRTRTRPTVPFGGVRHSGYGRELGALGIEEFVDVTAVIA